KPRSSAAIKCRARARYLYGALQIEDASRLAKFPVGLWGEIELWRRAPASHLYVSGRIRPNRHRGVQHVRYGKHEVFQPFVQITDALVRLSDLLSDLLHLRQQGLGIFAGALQPGDLATGLVAFGLQPFAGGNRVAAFAVQNAKTVEIDARA